MEYRLIVWERKMEINKWGVATYGPMLTIEDFEEWLNKECADGWAVKLCLEHNADVKKYLLERVKSA
jgi:hypothetical protein